MYTYSTYSLDNEHRRDHDEADTYTSHIEHH